MIVNAYYRLQYIPPLLLSCLPLPWILKRAQVGTLKYLVHTAHTLCLSPPDLPLPASILVSGTLVSLPDAPFLLPRATACCLHIQSLAQSQARPGA